MRTKAFKKPSRRQTTGLKHEPSRLTSMDMFCLLILAGILAGIVYILIFGAR